MDLDLFMRVTHEMREAGVQEIGLFYLGESLMAPELLIDALKWVKLIGFPYVFLTTNGTMCYPEVAEQLFAHKLDSLKFSMNAADEEQYEHVMGVKGKLLWEATANLREARRIRDEMGSKCGIYASSIRYDGEQQRRMEAFLSAYVLPFVDQHYWLPTYSMSMRAAELREKFGWKVTVGNIGRYDQELKTGNRASQSVCWSAFSEGHVRADGHLSACCFGSDDRFDVGDLTRQPFMAAWHSQEFQDIRKLHLRVSEEGPEVLRGSMCEVCIDKE
jgi:hypothetical protein